jgi:hypothetical protein
VGRGDTIVDEKLFKSILCKRFESKDVQDTNVRERRGIHSIWLERSSNAMNDPVEYHLPDRAGVEIKREEQGADLVNRFGNRIASIYGLDGVERDAIGGSSSRASSSSRGHV